MSKNALIIFAKNPELGKVKTRLAQDLGEEKALKVYLELLEYTQSITKNIQKITLIVYFSNFIDTSNFWDENIYNKNIQKGDDLGERMSQAFVETLNQGFSKVIGIGTDNFELNQNLIEEAFRKLDNNDLVFGPAFDGGYYLIGMKKYHPKLFQNKKWSTETVLSDSLKDYPKAKVYTLKTLNDIDTLKDLQKVCKVF